MAMNRLKAEKVELIKLDNVMVAEEGVEEVEDYKTMNMMMLNLVIISVVVMAMKRVKTEWQEVSEWDNDSVADKVMEGIDAECRLVIGLSVSSKTTPITLNHVRAHNSNRKLHQNGQGLDGLRINGLAGDGEGEWLRLETLFREKK